MISRIDAKEREILIHEISELNSMLSAFAASLTENGVKNANS